MITLINYLSALKWLLSCWFSEEFFFYFSTDFLIMKAKVNKSHLIFLLLRLDSFNVLRWFPVYPDQRLLLSEGSHKNYLKQPLQSFHFFLLFQQCLQPRLISF